MRELLLLAVAQSGGGFVQQQQDRIGGERAGNFDNPLLAERQVGGHIEHMRREPGARYDLRRGSARSRFLCTIKT